jgi:type II secretory pathway component GspD/PulD (secretin)
MRYVIAAALLLLAVGASGRADEPKAGQVVSLNVLLADVGGAALGEGEVSAAKVLDLEKQGKLDAAARVQLSVIENTPGVANFSETVPVTTGRQDGAGFPGGGRGGSAYSMQNHGTMVQSTARVEQDGTIVLELQIERSRLVANRPVGEEGGAATVAATKAVQVRLNTTTRVASGKAAIIGSQQAGVGKEAIHTYIVLTASVPEGGKAAAAAPAPAVVTMVFALSHARAADLVRILQSVLEGQRITIAADERSNSLIVHGAEDVLHVAIGLIGRLDEAQTRLEQ